MLCERGVRSLSETKPRGRRPVPRPEDFPHRTVETIRIGDLDRQNHINNAVFATFFESGRVIILCGKEYGLIVPGASFVLAHLSINFLGEMHWPGKVEIGTAIAGVGNSSLQLDQALFVKGVCVAIAQNTHGAGRQGNPKTAAVCAGARRADQGVGAGGARDGVNITAHSRRLLKSSNGVRSSAGGDTDTADDR